MLENNLIIETWKAVIGYEGIYEVSDLGNLRRIIPWWNGRAWRNPTGCLKPQPSRKYKHVSLYKDGVCVQVTIHSIVAAAFIGPVPLGKQINHKNGVHADNKVLNLEYLTPSENQTHARRVLKVGNQDGSKNPAAKLTESEVLDIRRHYESGNTMDDIAKTFRVHRATVSDAIHRRTWKHI